MTFGARHTQNHYGNGTFHNYVIAGNVCGAFAFGDVGKRDEFFLIGAEPDLATAHYPLLTGNILDARGHLLCRIVRNLIDLNPGNCRKILGHETGYTIFDDANNRLLSVQTEFNADDPDGRFVTTLAGRLYDSAGRVAMVTNHGENEYLEGNTKHAFGTRHGLIFNMGLDDNESMVATAAIRSGGSIYELVTGEWAEDVLPLDGKMLIDAEVIGKRIIVATGEFLLVRAKMERCHFAFEGVAGNIYGLTQALSRQPADPQGQV